MCHVTLTKLKIIKFCELNQFQHLTPQNFVGFVQEGNISRFCLKKKEKVTLKFFIDLFNAITFGSDRPFRDSKNKIF